MVSSRQKLRLESLRNGPGLMKKWNFQLLKVQQKKLLVLWKVLSWAESNQNFYFVELFQRYPLLTFNARDSLQKWKDKKRCLISIQRFACISKWNFFIKLSFFIILIKMCNFCRLTTANLILWNRVIFTKDMVSSEIAKFSFSQFSICFSFIFSAHRRTFSFISGWRGITGNFFDRFIWFFRFTLLISWGGDWEFTFFLRGLASPTVVTWFIFQRLKKCKKFEFPKKKKIKKNEINLKILKINIDFLFFFFPVAVVVAFIICWAPFHAQRLLAIYGLRSAHHPSSTVLFLYTVLTYVSGILYYLSATINPILYNIMSNRFRRAFKVCRHFILLVLW